ncbi:dynamin central region family protein [Babesia divergens]|uniref:Dynamin central region family protein n=1 Tax=Babesia divergens TaxID=32595 RepID=A0AAD9GEX3_BABDI|nr:dynamin central region family protein [Babesia divergens]
MEELIPIVSRLHSILTATGQSSLELPAVAVVGAQSVGKSSVLEAMVGRPFLPKGTGIVTRRPLILQLRYDGEATEYGEFAHKRGIIFDDFRKIEEEITAETERLLGGTKNVSPVPIFLKIVSPRVVDLTLIDLPGITKVPVGDQTHDIEHQIRQMITEYIGKPSCIILALTSANMDIATSDSLQMAREVDPEGARTIGVITKCDMVEDKGSALEVLRGGIYKLRRGYVGVVCKDKQGNPDLRHDPAEEEEFFKQHHIYAPISNKCGIRHLARLLNEMLTSHIKEILPHVKAKVMSILHEREGELLSYGFGAGDDAASPSSCLLHFFTSFSQRFKDLVDGKMSSQQHASQLFGGARINYIFNDSYLKTLKAFNPLAGLSDLEIRTAIRNSTGPCSALFVPEVAFANLVKKQIQLLEMPSLQCVDQVYEELLNILESCNVPELNRFVNLRLKMVSVIKELLRRCLSPTKEMIRNIIKIELAYINTNHPDFLKSNALAKAYNPQGRAQRGQSNYNAQYGYPSRSNSVNYHGETPREYNSDLHEGKSNHRVQGGECSRTSGKYEKTGKFGTSLANPRDLPVQNEQQLLWLPNVPKVVSLGNDPTEREVVEAELIKTLIDSYFSIVRKNIADAVPKCIMYFMVNKAAESVQQELISQLYKKELYNELTAESKEIIEKRQKCIDTLKSLRHCLAELNEIAGFRLEE